MAPPFTRYDGSEGVLAFRYATPEPRRSALEWALALVFYAAIALVIMIWLWPLTRDLRKLERSTQRFGDRNWTFAAKCTTMRPVCRAMRT